jgi:hypothetical protein
MRRQKEFHDFSDCSRVRLAELLSATKPRGTELGSYSLDESFAVQQGASAMMLEAEPSLTYRERSWLFAKSEIMLA